MRITNKIIQNNSLNNINTNKQLEDTLSTMLSSNKKIARPSDDPIIALRSLRLRTSVNQVTQYVEKNVEDAKSWLTVTEKAIDTLSEIITDVRKQYVKGTSDTLKPEDRTIITDNLEALAAEIYNTGNADFAGRSVFAGYRTDTTITFQKQEDINYEITEKFEDVTIDSIQYVNQGADENSTFVSDIVRIRLSYDKVDNLSSLSIASKLAPGTITIETVSSTATPYDPYQTIISHNNDDYAVFVPETGELLLSKKVADSADDITDCSLTYNRSKWAKGELRPEHYFDCTSTNFVTNEVKEYKSHGGEIQYNIGVNQSLRINTTADECFTHNIVRDLQDVIEAIKDVNDVEKRINTLKSKYNELPETNIAARDALQKEIDAAEKAYTFLNDKMHTLFSKSITKADGYLDKNNIALTDCGTRSKRLDLIENRLDTQLESLKELKSENEDADLAETAIQMKSAEYSYNASLMATSKILQETLLNYI
ncbi:MAG: hypothetical protein K5679_12185 [Lachnospiraceae bacterium]|nr:hypothetical protein [Lachnospiraceae bacterium]